MSNVYLPVIRRVLTIVLAYWAAACGPLIPTPSDEIAFFVIEEQDSTFQLRDAADARHDVSLLVRETKANRFVNSHKIVFSKDSAQRGYYQFAQWVEPPPSRLTTLLIEKLDKANVCSSVSRLGGAALGDYQLNSELNDYYHDINERPGTTRVQLTVELVDLAKRVVVAQKTFSISKQATAYSAQGAVEGLTEASNQLLDEVVKWLEEKISESQPEKE